MTLTLSALRRSSTPLGEELERFVEILGYVNNGLYLALAAIAFQQWRRLRGESAAWLAVTFSVLAAIGLVALFLPEGDEAQMSGWLIKAVIVGVVIFPYCLFRFMASFVRPSPFASKLALGATVVVSVYSIALPEIPGPGDPTSVVFNVWLFALGVQWSGLLISVAYHFWRAGRGQPTVPRRRMRLLSLASIGMTLALVVALAASNSTDPAVQLATTLFATASVIAFFLGFAPPKSIRIMWRSAEQDALRVGIRDLLQARDTEDVAERLLPHMTRIVGARSAELFNASGETLASYTEGGDDGAASSQPGPSSEELWLDFAFGSLKISASPYTPYFGRDEVELLETLGAMAGLAIERTNLFDKERDARRAIEQANVGLAEANDELHESQRRLAEAQAVAQIGSFEWDVAHDRVAWSDQMFRNFGRPPGSMQVDYTSYLELVDERDREFVSGEIGRALENLNPYEFDHRIQTPDGDTRVLHARGLVDVDSEGRATRIHGTAQDVTDLRRAEANLNVALEREREARRSLEGLNDEMESFVYSVSHDLNSPLISLLGFLEFLEKDFGTLIPDKGRFYMERMTNSARYMQSLIKDLLDLSRIGRVQTHPEPVELDELLEEIEFEIRSSAPNFVLESNDLPTIYMNKLRARQLFGNLLNNSVKYGGEGVRVRVGAQMTDDGFFEISVGDDGPGIAPEHRARVFGVFERLQGPTSSEGTGIGLSICKRIVETLGGSIWIADSSEGLEMRFTLPSMPSSLTSNPEVADRRAVADG